MRLSRVSLEATELNADESAWTEAGVFINRDDEPEPEMREQLLLMTPPEMLALYQRLRTYYEQGTWTEGPVEHAGDSFLWPGETGNGIAP